MEIDPGRILEWFRGCRRYGLRGYRARDGYSRFSPGAGGVLWCRGVENDPRVDLARWRVPDRHRSSGHGGSDREGHRTYREGDGSFAERVPGALCGCEGCETGGREDP